MNTTTNNIDETTNHDLPGEIHEWTEDPADRQYHDARRALDSMTLPMGCRCYECCEIEDLHDGNCEVMIIDNPYTDAPAGDEDWRDPKVWDDENDAPDFDEESMGADGDIYDVEDDSWSDSGSLTSCGWGEDESYGCFE